MPRGDARVHELGRAQQALVRRVAEAKATVPEWTLSARADVTRTVGALPPDVEWDDLVVKAAALALRAVPRANAAYRDGRWELYDRVNVAFAVAVEDGLVAPVLEDADTRALADLAAQRRALVERARAGALTSPEQSGATFTVLTLEAESAQAILVPPQAAILAAGAPRPAPVVRDGAVTAGRAATLTLTADARILYGPPAAEFLGRAVTALEEPGTV